MVDDEIRTGYIRAQLKNINNSYIHESLDEHYYEFNSALSNWIVAASFFITLGILAAYLLHHYSKKDDEDEELILPSFLFTISLTISLAAMLLMPITVISHEIVAFYPKNYYLQWINKELIFGLWNSIFVGANLSLLVLIPFAYFYYESGGKQILHRFCEATVVLVLVECIMGGLIYLAHWLLFNSDGDYLLFSYSILSLAGSLLVLGATPVGFTTLTAWGFNLKRKFISKYTIFQLELEMDTLKNKIEIAANADQKEQISKEIQELTEEHKQAKQATSKAFIFYNFSSIFFTIFNLLCPLFVLLRIFISLARAIVNLEQQDMYQFLALEGNATSRYGSIVHTIEIILIMYVMSSAFTGLYRLPGFSWLRPKVKGTPMHKMALNLVFLLLVSSSFPIVVRTLDLTSFDLMGYYNYVNAHNAPLLQAIYKLMFLIRMGQQYFKLLLTFEPLKKILFKSKKL